MMRGRPPKSLEVRGSHFRLGYALVAFLTLAAWAGSSRAQDGRRIPLPSPPPPPPPRVEDVPIRARPATAAPEKPKDSGIVDRLAGPSSLIEIKVGQGRFLTLREDLAVAGQPAPFLAVGDPTVADFFQVGPRQLRLIGKRLGTTDLTITTSAGRTFDYELRINGDLDFLDAQLKKMFPDARLALTQLREKIVVEGEARDAGEVMRILSVIDSYVRSIQRVLVPGQVSNVQNVIQGADPNAQPPGSGADAQGFQNPAGGPGVFPGSVPGAFPSGSGMGLAMGGVGGTQITPGTIATNQIATNQVQVINLIRVPTSQQVLLKVRVAELNRTGFRQIGADFLASIPQFGTLFGTQIGGATFAPGQLGSTTYGLRNGNNVIIPQDVRDLTVSTQTVFGTFSHGQFNAVLAALRRNNILKILAEPNLVTLNGHQASFLAGGEFPVPVLAGFGGGAGGGGSSINVQFKEFGVRLSFLPIVEDHDTIRLTVDPEVSTVDATLSTTLVPGGSPVPGLNTRKSHTTVELKQGETLAIAGLMQLTLSAQTARIPGLGDLPYIGAFFSNTTSTRIEKELVVLVTPYLVEPMKPGQVPPTPGEEYVEPNDLEFFFMNRIEGRTGIDGRSTTSYDDPLHLVRPALVERKYLIGPSGYQK